MKKFEEAKLEVVEFEAQDDILTSSCQTDGCPGNAPCPIEGQ